MSCNNKNKNPNAVRVRREKTTEAEEAYMAYKNSKQQSFIDSCVDYLVTLPQVMKIPDTQFTLNLQEEYVDFVELKLNVFGHSVVRQDNCLIVTPKV